MYIWTGPETNKEFWFSSDDKSQDLQRSRDYTINCIQNHTYTCIVTHDYKHQYIYIYIYIPPLNSCQTLKVTDVQFPPLSLSLIAVLHTYTVAHFVCKRNKIWVLCSISYSSRIRIDKKSLFDDIMCDTPAHLEFLREGWKNLSLSLAFFFRRRINERYV